MYVLVNDESKKNNKYCKLIFVLHIDLYSSFMFC